MLTTLYAKTDNLNLKSLSLSVQGLEPAFDPNRTQYGLFVDSKVQDIEVTAQAEDSSASVTVTGNKGLNLGDNEIVITVANTQGEKNEYVIRVIKTTDREKSDSFLQNLILQNIELKPEFDPYTLTYTGTEIPSDVTTIDMFTSPRATDATVVISGNENLQPGENTITVTVTSPDKLTKKDYIIRLNKSKTATTEEVVKQNLEQDNKENFVIYPYRYWIGGGIIGVFVLVIVYSILRKKGKNG